MNEPTSTTASNPSPSAATIKRAVVSKHLTKKVKVPRAPRIVDPGIVAIRASAAAQVSEFRSAQASEKILKTIVEKRLPKLTTGDKEKLLDHLELKESVTPSLPVFGGQVPALVLPLPTGPVDDRGAVE